MQTVRIQYAPFAFNIKYKQLLNCLNNTKSGLSNTDQNKLQYKPI